MEVFHSRMLCLVREFNKMLIEQAKSPSLPLKQACRSLSLGLHVLECYRVVLLRRPPDRLFRTCFGVGNHEKAQDESTARLIDTLSSPDISLNPEYSYYDAATAPLTIAVSASIRLTSSDPSSLVRTLWRSEYFELALSKWSSIRFPDSDDWSLSTLYHLTCISLHTNIGLIHRLVHASSGIHAYDGANTA